MWLMGNPKPVSVMGATYAAFGKRKDVVSIWGPWDPAKFDVDDMGVGFVRFENGAMLILRASWAANIERVLRDAHPGDAGGAFMQPLRIYKEMHQTLVDVTPAFSAGG